MSREEKEHPIPHEAEFSPEPAFRLALDKLGQMEWGKKDGFQLCDPAVFVERYGAPAVLYATWCAGGKGIQNPAAFVTWWCQQGKQAPEGWQHPELRQPAPASLSPSALEMPVAPIQAPELPKTPEALQPAWEWIRERIRPQSWRVWFAPHSMTSELNGEEVYFWAGSPVAANWIEGRYSGLIEEALKETLGYVPEVRFKVGGGVGRG
jgi:hypothetical protein